MFLILFYSCIILVVPKKEKKVSGVYVRSQMITPVKSQALLQKVSNILDELGVGTCTKTYLVVVYFTL